MMTRPKRFLTRIFVFLVAVIAASAFVLEALINAFLANPALNGLIGGVLIIGIVYICRQLFSLGREAEWIDTLRRPGAGIVAGTPPSLLAPMAGMIGDGGVVSLSSLSLRSILDSISARLDESRDLSRYMIGLLVFLGLLGTFWGLLQTIGSIGGTIDSLSVQSADFGVVFEDLKAGLKGPLAGMGTAFSSSLFGLAGSLVLGFLDLQASSAQNRFYNELEEWLSGLTTLSTGGVGGGITEGDGSMPTYVTALLEQTAETIRSLQTSQGRDQEIRTATNSTLMHLAEQIATLNDKLARDIETGFDEASKGHLRNLDVHMQKLVKDQEEGRNHVIEELRAEIRLLTRAVSALADRDRT